MRAEAVPSRRAAAVRALALAAAGWAAAAAPGAAQETVNRVDAFRDWSVFAADDGGPVCWVVTEPQSSEARRGGSLVRVRRGDIYLMVAVRPEAGVDHAASFVSGYPIRMNSEVEVRIGSDEFDFFTAEDSEEEYAWARPEQDGDVIEAMKAGVTAVVTGVSARGTTTIDRFSLLGFTDALTAAADRCE